MRYFFVQKNKDYTYELEVVKNQEQYNDIYAHAKELVEEDEILARYL